MEPIRITPAAAEQIKAALQAQADDDLALRVAARRTDSGETEYGMGFDERREQDEEIVTESGITLLVSPTSREAIAGTVIDFIEVAPGERRFVFYRAGALPDEDSAQSPARTGPE
ncbi:MAG: HesB/IscA family protein [Gemmatimonadota bacterium]